MIRQKGFTLIELLAVVAIASILAGFAALSLNFDNVGKAVEEQTRQIAALMQVSSDEAIYLGKELGIRFSPDSFTFYQLEKPKKGGKPAWKPVTSDRRLRTRTIPNGFELEMEIADVVIVLDEPSKEDVKVNKVKPQIMFLSNGEITPDFSVTVLDETGEHKYRVYSAEEVPILFEKPE